MQCACVAVQCAYVAVYNAQMWQELRTNDLVHTFIGFVEAAVEHYFLYTFGYFDKRKPVRNRKSIWDLSNFVSGVFFFLLYVHVCT